MSTPTDPASVHPAAVATDLPRRASFRLRFAHALSALTLRKLGNITVRIDLDRLMTQRQMLGVAGLLDSIAVVLPPPPGTRLRAVSFPDFDAEWVWHRNVSAPDEHDAAIIYFHGGALVAGGLNSHRRLVARVARATGAPVLNVCYRQIPQVHITETVDDCVHAYRYLLDQEFPAQRIIVAGDSAGGGLAFALALAARDRGLPMPGGVVAISPWANYDSTRKRAHPNNRSDPALSAEFLMMPPAWGMAVDGKLDAAWSPVNHDFSGLPPTLIQIGSTEVLMADVEELAARCAQAGIPLRLQIWDRGIHVFHAAADLIPDAREAIADLGSFVRGLLDRTDSTGTN